MALEIVDEVFSKLSKLPSFNISEKKLYMFLNKSNFQDNLDKLEEEANITPYTIFIKEQLNNGVELKDVLDLWKKTKNNKTQYNIYLDKYNKYKETQCEENEYLDH